MDPNATQMFDPDPNRTRMGDAPSLNVTQTIAPTQCPVCKTFNPAGEGFCVECGLIFHSALPEDAFGAPAIRPPCLVDASGREHFLRPGVNTVGREGDVLISDGRVSRRHAEVIFEEGVVSVRDLGSTNGTTVAGEAVGEDAVELNHGDDVEFAGNKMTLNIPGVAGATQMLAGNKTQALDAPPSVAPAPAAAILVIGDEEFDLSMGENTVGRRGENDIVLEDPYVSGKHAVITVSDTGITLTDVGSTNGSFIGGAKLAPNDPVTITANDEIILGRTDVRIRNV